MRTKRIRVAVTWMVGLGLVALGLRLSYWQWHKAELKRDVSAQRQAQASKQALAPACLPETAAESGQAVRPASPQASPASEASPTSAQAACGPLAERWGRQMTVYGQWVAGRTLFLDNRQMNGRVGFHVLTPLVLADGRWLLVQRGFTPRDFQQRDRLPVWPMVAGIVSVPGTLRPEASAAYVLGEPGRGAIRQAVSLPALEAEWGQRLVPAVLWQSGDEQPAPGPDVPALDRRWPEPRVDVSKHEGYAFQWLALSAGVLALLIWHQVIQPRRQRQHDRE